MKKWAAAPRAETPSGAIVRSPTISPGDGPSGVPEDCKSRRLPGAGPDLWVGDYTISPENGAVGVFAHEFGHDLGLPDLYDTSYAGESSVEFWSLMSGGSWGSRPGDPIGTNPTHMDAWSKVALGWVRDADLGEYDYSGTPAAEATSSTWARLRVLPPVATRSSG